MIDDEKSQAMALARTIESVVPMSKAFHASERDEIIDYIENKFYNLAILDIRMDGLEFNGITLARRILEINPFAKILFVSRFIPEYIEELTPLMQNGNILGFSDKQVDYDKWGVELKKKITEYYDQLDSNPQSVNTALINMYSQLKDEENTYIKGQKFEDFISLLFQSFGFSEIMKRTRDKSLNEVDLIVRNEIDDAFLSKFGKYILIECKNHLNAIDKNDFIIFKSKLKATNGLAELGFFITTSSFKRTTYLEALRSSEGHQKIVFIDNSLMMRLLKSTDLREELKRIIDRQVKDN